MIWVQQVKVIYKDFSLEIDDLRLKPGLTILVGRNGAGKSTFLKLLATALLPDSGKILYEGMELEEALPIIRNQIGFLPTGLELYDEMTPKQLLSYLADLKGVQSGKMVNWLMEEFQLTAYKHKKIKMLPHGIRQRIGIAQAFLGSPRYLFLDEPLTYLDSIERKRVVAFLSHYARNRFIVISTHELNEWEGQADWILWQDQGRVCFYDLPVTWVGIDRSLSLEEAYFARQVAGDNMNYR